MAALKVHATTKTRGSASQLPSRAMSAPSDVEVTVKVLAWAGLAPRSTPTDTETNTARTHKVRVLAHPAHIAFSTAISGMLLTRSLLSLALRWGGVQSKHPA